MLFFIFMKSFFIHTKKIEYFLIQPNKIDQKKNPNSQP